MTGQPVLSGAVKAILNAHVAPLPIEALPRDVRVPLDPAAGRAAWAEFEAVREQVTPMDAVMLACLAYVRFQASRRAR